MFLKIKKILPASFDFLKDGPRINFVLFSLNKPESIIYEDAYISISLTNYRHVVLGNS